MNKLPISNKEQEARRARALQRNKDWQELRRARILKWRKEIYHLLDESLEYLTSRNLEKDIAEKSLVTMIASVHLSKWWGVPNADDKVRIIDAIDEALALGSENIPLFVEYYRRMMSPNWGSLLGVKMPQELRDEEIRLVALLEMVKPS